VTEQGPNLQQQMQQQVVQQTQDFYAQSVGSLRSQIEGYRSQLEQYAQQVPEGDAQAQIQEMIDSYMELEGSMDQAAQDQGVEDAMNQAAQQTQQQIQQTAQGAAQQGQQAAGQAAQQAGGGQQQQQQPNATQAAENKAQELGVDLSQVQGSGAEGRITVRDVISAANQ